MLVSITLQWKITFKVCFQLFETTTLFVNSVWI